VVRVHHRP